MKVELLTLRNEANEETVRAETSSYLTTTNGFLTIRTDKNPAVKVDYRRLHDTLFDWCQEYMVFGEAHLNVEPIDGSYYRCTVNYKSMNAVGEVVSPERYDSYFSPLHKLAVQLKTDQEAMTKSAIQHNAVDHVYVVGYDDSPAMKETMVSMVPEIVAAVGSKPEDLTIFKYEDRGLAVVLTDDSVDLLEIHQ